MKKFLVTLIILVILGGVAFIFGWVQFSVPLGKYGVIISKTHGIDPNLVRSGEFRWVWYKLIPTNVKIAIFSLNHSKYPINLSSSLASGDTYASFAGITNADFSWSLRGEISFNIKPETLVALTQKNNLSSQEDLDSYLQNAAKEIEIIILREFSSASMDSERLERIMSGNADAELEREIKIKFPEIQAFSLIINSVKYPDFVLYRQIRLLYEDFMVGHREYLSSSFSRRAENLINTQLRFEELERYGDLFTRYPILLEYLPMENLRNQ